MAGNVCDGDLAPFVVCVLRRFDNRDWKHVIQRVFHAGVLAFALLSKAVATVQCHMHDELTLEVLYIGKLRS